MREAPWAKDHSAGAVRPSPLRAQQPPPSSCPAPPHLQVALA